MTVGFSYFHAAGDLFATIKTDDNNMYHVWDHLSKRLGSMHTVKRT